MSPLSPHVDVLRCLLWSGRWNIRRLKTQADLKKLVGSDPFHTLVNQSTFKIVFTIMGMVRSENALESSEEQTSGCTIENYCSSAPSPRAGHMLSAVYHARSLTFCPSVSDWP